MLCLYNFQTQITPLTSTFQKSLIFLVSPFVLKGILQRLDRLDYKSAALALRLLHFQNGEQIKALELSFQQRSRIPCHCQSLNLDLQSPVDSKQKTNHSRRRTDPRNTEPPARS